MQLGAVNGPDDLRRFVQTSLQQAAAFSAPFALAVREDVGRFDALDRLHHAMLASDVASRASRAQGKALAMTASEVWPLPALRELRGRLRSADVPGHLCTCFGYLAGVLELGSRETAEAFLFMQVRGVLSAAVRLAVVGTIEAQRLQADLAGEHARAVERALATPVESAAQTAPMLDLLQSQHDRLYSRLFLS